MQVPYFFMYFRLHKQIKNKIKNKIKIKLYNAFLHTRHVFYQMWFVTIKYNF
jgi:hypothetical protein